MLAYTYPHSSSKNPTKHTGSRRDNELNNTTYPQTMGENSLWSWIWITTIFKKDNFEFWYVQRWDKCHLKNTTFVWWNLISPSFLSWIREQQRTFILSGMKSTRYNASISDYANFLAKRRDLTTAIPQILHKCKEFQIKNGDA